MILLEIGIMVGVGAFIIAFCEEMVDYVNQPRR